MLVEIKKDNICFITLNKSRTNSLDIEFSSKILDKLTEIDEDPDIRIVSLSSGQDFGFSSGLDLRACYNEDSETETAENVKKAVKLVYSISTLILRSPKIYLAALAGPVIGSSISIALSCDLRIAADDMWFWSPDPQYGGILADGGIELTSALIGASPATMLHLTNDRIKAEKAYAWGLLYKIVAKDALSAELTNTAQRLSLFSPYSLAQSKKLMPASRQR